MCAEQRKSNLRSNAAHIKERGEETLLVATGEANKPFAIFSNKVMEIELNLRTLCERTDRYGNGVDFPVFLSTQTIFAAPSA